MKFCHEKLESLGQPTVNSENFMILACTVLIRLQSVTDERTDGQKDAQAMAKTRKAFCYRA